MPKKHAIKPINSPNYSFWQALWRSFFDGNLYVDVYRHWRGFAYRYLMFLLALVALPLSVFALLHLHASFQHKISEPLAHIPKLVIQNGVVSAKDLTMPYTSRDKEGRVVFIVDTRDAPIRLQDYPDALLLIAKNAVFYRTNVLGNALPGLGEAGADAIVEEPLSVSTNQIFIGQDWVQSGYINRLLGMAMLSIYPSIFLLLLTAYSVFVFLFAAVGQIVAKILMSLTLSYKESVRIISVALTPQCALMCFILSGLLYVPLSGLFLLGLLGAYFGYAVAVIKRQTRKMVRL